MPLPYVDYSWSFTQHAIAYEPRNLFGLLRAAFLVSGQEEVREVVNRFLADNDILTQNLRAGRGPDAWRDYQQALPELGLMFSTTVLPQVTLTPMGEALLDGMIGYSEALTTQALRYQYPNGFKSAVTHQQAEHGVLIKPAVLILRTLLSLFDTDPAEAYLSASELQHYLIPIIDYRTDPPSGGLIIRNRRKEMPLIQHGRRRNVQDWMSFLKRTDLFTAHRGSLRLSEIAVADRAKINALIDHHSRADSFWIAGADSQRDSIRWFDHYGSIAMVSQWVRSEVEIDAEYERNNYLQGRDGPSGLGPAEPEPPGGIGYERIGERLRGVAAPADGPGIGIRRLVDFAPPDLAAVEAQYARSEKSRALHARMVREIAATFRDRGAEVVEDPNSVDLLVSNGRREGIIEVKTVIPRNLRYRVRLGVGQLFEYQYRRRLETHNTPNLVLALSSPIRRNDSRILELAPTNRAPDPERYRSISSLPGRRQHYLGHFAVVAFHSRRPYVTRFHSMGLTRDFRPGLSHGVPFGTGVAMAGAGRRPVGFSLNSPW